MTRLTYLVASVVVAAIATISVPVTAPAQSDEEMARLNAEARQLDPVDYPFVQAVCTVCHTPEMFLRVHSWEEWQGLFHDMISYGASGSAEQWDHIDKYFQRTLTTINVNHALEDELVGVLGVDEPTAIRIVQRANTRRITSAADLLTVAGVTQDAIDRLGPRLEF
jgi:hypothetical protein